jgi:hypothetical protein
MLSAPFTRMSLFGLLGAVPFWRVSRSELGDPVTCDSPWRAESAEAMLLPRLVTFNPVELLTVNPFHLKKGSMLPASNDNFIELAAGKGAILSAPSQLRGLASKPFIRQ